MVAVFYPPRPLANPTASVGLTAVNGSAQTAMRSDAAPPLDQTAAYAFSGLGATNAASLTLGGATLGANILAVTGTSSFNAGNTVINTSGSFVTVGDIVAGASQFIGFSGRTFFSAPADGTIQIQNAASTRISQFSIPVSNTFQFGPADVASPTAQTIQAQSVVTGTTDTAGQDWSLIGSLSTGSGAAGKVIIKTGFQTTTGSTVNAAAAVATFGPSSILSTTAVPALSIAQTWNNAGLTSPTAFLLNVTNTSSAGTPLLFDIQKGGVSQFKLNSNGTLTHSAGNLIVSSGSVRVTTDSGVFSLGASSDITLSRANAAVLQLGAANGDTTGTSQTLQAQGVTTGGTNNQAGGALTLRPGQGKGNVTSSFKIQTYPAGASGNTLQTATDALTIDGAQLATFGGPIKLANAYVATPQVSTGYVTIQDNTGTTYKVCVAP